MRAGMSFLLNFPAVLNLMTKDIVTKNDAPRIETIVSNALLYDPIAMKVSAKPKPAAAPNARSIGFKGSP